MEALIEQPLPASGEDNVRCRSPAHADVHPSVTVQPDGRWYCIVCDVGGGPVEFCAHRWGLDPLRDKRALWKRIHECAPSDVSEPTAELPSSPSVPKKLHAVTPAEAEDFSEKSRVIAQSRCIQTLTARGISLATMNKVGAEPALVGRDLYIRLPGARPDGREQSVLHRLVEARSSDAPRYVADPERLGALWWPTADIGERCFVVITEGGLDAMTFTEIGICAASLPHGVSSATQADIVDEIAELHTDFERVVLCLDGDTAGKEATKKIIAALDERMPDRQEGYFVAVFPNGSKDANEVLQHAGPAAVEELVWGATATFAPKHPRGWLHNQEWIYQPVAPMQYVIEGILGVGHVGMFSGAGESLKSLTAYAIGLAACTAGGPVGAFEVHGGFATLIVNGEMNERQVRTRIQRLIRGAGVEGHAGLANLRVAHNTNFKIDESEWITALTRALENAPPTVIIVDSFRAVISRTDENNSSQVRAVVNGLRGIAELGHAIILIAHEAKMTRGTAAKYATAGSTDLYNNVDVTVRFLFDNPKEPVETSATKARDHSDDRGPWLSKVEEVSGDGLKIVEVPVVSKDVRTEKAVAGLLKPVEDVLRAAERYMSRNAIKEAVEAAGTKCTDKGVKAALPQLIASGVAVSREKKPGGKQLEYAIAGV
jgi:hypothetical protein